jgi:transcriptional repressor NrdR
VIVTNSRATNQEMQTWRRRKCLKCGFLFTTHEKIDFSHMTVVKHDGRRVKFVEGRLFSGIYRALVGGKDVNQGYARTNAQAMTERIGELLILSGKNETTTDTMADMALELLSKKNTGAWLRYLAYFKIDGKKYADKTLRRYFKKRAK